MDNSFFMDDNMLYPVILFLIIGFVIYKIIKVEYFEEEIENKSTKKYNKEQVLCLLNQFISKLNKEKKSEFDVYNIVKVKHIGNKLYIKVFVQHKTKQYVRLYYVQGKIPFKMNAEPELLFYTEHGIQEDIKNGVAKFTDSASYAKPILYNYIPPRENKTEDEIDVDIHELDNIGIMEVQKLGI